MQLLKDHTEYQFYNMELHDLLDTYDTCLNISQTFNRRLVSGPVSRFGHQGYFIHPVLLLFVRLNLLFIGFNDLNYLYFRMHRHYLLICSK